MDIPRAQPLPTGVTTLSLGSGAAEGLEAGNKMGYISAQTKAQELANQATAYSMTPAMRQLAIQQTQAEIAKKNAEVKKQKVDSALAFLGQVGDKVKFFTPESQKIAIANGMNAVADAAPEWGIQKTDPSKIPDEGVDLIQQYGKLYKARLDGEISEGEFQADGNQILTKMTQYQREMLKENQSVLGQPNFEPGQTGNQPGSPPAAFNTKSGVVTSPSGQPMPGSGFVPAATAASTISSNIREAATATAPIVNQAFSVNLAKTALAKGDELNDHIAINEFGKLVNNGTPVPMEELKKMMTSGTWGPKVKQAFSKWTGEGALSDEQRAMMQNALDTFGESLKSQATTRTSQFPGATPPPLPAISAYKVGQVVKFKQGSYKKIKDGPDTDPATWGPSK